MLPRKRYRARYSRNPSLKRRMPERMRISSGVKYRFCTKEETSFRPAKTAYPQSSGAPDKLAAGPALLSFGKKQAVGCGEIAHAYGKAVIRGMFPYGQRLFRKPVRRHKIRAGHKDYPTGVSEISLLAGGCLSPEKNRKGGTALSARPETRPRPRPRDVPPTIRKRRAKERKEGTALFPAEAGGMRPPIGAESAHVLSTQRYSSVTWAHQFAAGRRERHLTAGLFWYLYKRGGKP